MKRSLLFIVITLLFVSCKQQANNTIDDSKNTEVKTAINLMEVIDFKEAISSNKVQLIDVRTSEEYAEGHIENAINIDFLNDNFEQEILKIRKEKPVYIYCRSGGRSGEAAIAMEKLGFKNIYDLNGGFLAWNDK